MIALVVYIAITAAAAALVAWVVDRGGDVALAWDAWEISTSTPVLVLGVALVALAAVVAARLFSLLWRGPGRLRGALGRRRRERGYQALTSGLVAVAAGDPSEARRHARRADRLLDRPPLTLLLTAQAAQLDGDDAEAERRFLAMLERPETEFLGLRGLTAAALRKGDRATAGDYARRAHALRPDAAWAADAVFELQTLDGDWRGAEGTLKSARARRIVDAGAGRRRHAVLLVERARAALAGSDRDRALKCARAAHREAPGLVAASVLLARLLIDRQKHRSALAVIEETWALARHPDLARLHGEAGRDKGLARYRRVARLVKIAPTAHESHLAAAAQAIDLGLVGEARRHLGEIADDELSPEATRLWARLEESDGKPGEAAMWSARAVGPAWTWQCGSCGHVADDWHAVCAGCGGFDSIAWRRAVHVARPALDDGWSSAAVPGS